MKRALCLVLLLFLVHKSFAITCAELTSQDFPEPPDVVALQGPFGEALTNWVNQKADLKQKFAAAGQSFSPGPTMPPELAAKDEELFAFFEKFADAPAAALLALVHQNKSSFTFRMTALEAIGLIGLRAQTLVDRMFPRWEAWAGELRATLISATSVESPIQVKPPQDETRHALYKELARNAGPELAFQFLMGKVLMRIMKDPKPALTVQRRLFDSAWGSPAQGLLYSRGLIQADVMAALAWSDLPLAETTLVNLHEKMRVGAGLPGAAPAWVSHASVVASEMLVSRYRKPEMLKYFTDADGILIDIFAQRVVNGAAKQLSDSELGQMVFLIRGRRFLAGDTDPIEAELKERQEQAQGMPFSRVDLQRFRALAYAVMDGQSGNIAPGVEAAFTLIFRKLRQDMTAVYQPVAGSSPFEFMDLKENQAHLVQLMEILKRARWNVPRNLIEATSDLWKIPYMSDGNPSLSDRASDVREIWMGQR